MQEPQYSPRDGKIIRENEGKTAYELLELGLSQKGFDKLVAWEATKQQAPTQSTPNAGNDSQVDDAADATENGATNNGTGQSDGAIQPSATENWSANANRAAQPNTRPYEAPAPGINPGQVTVIGPTGIPTKMNRVDAQRLARNPEYRIVE